MPSAASIKAETRRFFAPFPQAEMALPAELIVEDEATVHHLRTVMRAKAGESIVVVDPQRETAYAAEIRELRKNAVLLTVTARLPEESPRLPHVVLVAALLKEQRWDFLLQKTTELGVRAIQPVMAERSVVKLGPDEFSKKRERWQAVVQAAAEQSEGLFIPQILNPITVTQLCNGTFPGPRFLLQERGEDRTPLREFLGRVKAGEPLMLGIGPEGGWSDGETQQFQQVGFELVSLGERIMRSETAAMAAMAAVVYESGR